MSRYIILAQSEATAHALNAWLRLLGEESLEKSDPRRIVCDQATMSRMAGIDAYETLVKLIETAARDDNTAMPLNAIVVLVDTFRPSQVSAAAEAGEWNHIIAMLILTFPEIRWIFGTYSVEGKDAAKWSSIAADHNLPSLLNRPRRDPLFDPTGLREWVRSETNTILRKVDDLQLPSRQALAAAIDEEKPYAYLHAYAAYRFGCRADVVTTWGLMKARFSEVPKESDKAASTKNLEPHGYWLLFEDMSLNFPDRRKNVHLLRLEQRAEECRKLSLNKDTSEHRILVTTGQTRPGDTALVENRSYLRSKSNGKGLILFKPASGIFDLWTRAGLFRMRDGNQRRGNAPGFCWPPAPPKWSTAEVTGHGAPGKLMLIAENLIRRAEQLLANVSTVPSAVQGAVLASDALELTGGRTPTTAIEALTLKHSFEVMAECQFSGVEYHILMQPRLKEIVGETASICRWFHARQRRSAALNAEMHVLNKILPILRESNQFDEEQICMNRIRRLHNTLWMRQKPIRLVAWPLLRYVEMLLSSFSVFIVALFAWVLLLSLLFWWTGHPNWEYGISDAITSFFSVGGPIHREDSLAIVGWRHVIVTATAILSGFIHLGVFISHLYSITTRR